MKKILSMILTILIVAALNAETGYDIMKKADEVAEPKTSSSTATLTIHFTNHIKYHFELTGNYRSAVLNSYREIGKTMIMTTIILCAMFGIFLTSTMTVLVNIGWLSIVGLGSALIADYTLTPVLLFITKPFGKETK